MAVSTLNVSLSAESSPDPLACFLSSRRSDDRKSNRRYDTYRRADNGKSEKQRVARYVSPNGRRRARHRAHDVRSHRGSGLARNEGPEPASVRDVRC
jgi:hypothetical protein